MRDGSARAPALAAFLASVVLFAPSLTNGFAFDDQTIVVAHEALHDLGELPGLLTKPYWPVPDGRELGVWRPITTAALGLAWAAGDGAPWVFHALNVVVHALSAALVALLAAALFGTVAAWGAGLLFAVHPVHVEAVANVVGLGELLAACTVLGACVVLVRSPPGRPLGAGRTLAILGLFLMGLLSKEGAAVLPGLIVVLDATRERLRFQDLRAWLLRRAPLLAGLVAVLAAVLLARHAVLGTAVSTRPPLGAELLEDIPRIWTMAPIWLEYLRLLVWPARLLPDYAPGVLPVRTAWSPAGVIGAGAVLGLLGLALLVARRERHGEADPPRAAAGLPLGVLWFVIAILPASNLLFLGGFLLAERTLYVPSVGFALAVGAGVAALVRSRVGALVRPVGALLLALLATRAFTYIPVWTDSDTVFDHLAREAPESGRFLWYYGDQLVDAGRVDEGALVYRRAIPVLGSAHFFLTGAGRRLLENGRPDHARVLLLRAVEVWPDHHGAPLRLAMLESGQGRWAEAERWSRRVLALDQARVESWHLLAAALARQGRWAEAGAAREELLERGERQAWQQWLWLGEARARSGDPSGARAALDSARVRGADPAALVGLEALLDAPATSDTALQSSGILQNPRRP